MVAEGGKRYSFIPRVQINSDVILDFRSISIFAATPTGPSNAG